MKKDKLTRRTFLAGTTGAALSAMIVPRHVLGGTGYDALPLEGAVGPIAGCAGLFAAALAETDTAGV